uniref:Enoyl acyl carrier protein reductase n=1 Tax=Gambierdiscus belizeanus TaxID=439316 RepID=A0A1S6K805_9DINO|nr:enoyl acyl carrier protein reductase [Gambierdiscus belizeanus]
MVSSSQVRRAPAGPAQLPPPLAPRMAGLRRSTLAPCALAGVVALAFSGLRVLAPAFTATPAPRPLVERGVAQRCGTTCAGGSLPSPQAGALRAMPRGLVSRRALTVDLSGKVAFIAGIGDTSGFGWAIARELAEAGCTILVGTWPPVLKVFTMLLKKKGTEEAKKLSDGSLMEIAKIYPLDAAFDVPDDVPEEVKSNKRYAGVGAYTIQEVVDQVKEDYGKIDFLVHSLANGPEVTKPLLETSRAGYLAASSASAYSLVSMVSKFGPIMNEGGSALSLSYIASERVIPGYGGGMSSAKAQLESDTRTLSWEAGRKYGVRVNTISAGPLKSRAASAIGGDGEKTFIERAIDYSVSNAPLTAPLFAENVGTAALCLLSPLMAGVTGVTLYVDMGLHAMGQSVDSPAFEGLNIGK